MINHIPESIHNNVVLTAITNKLFEVAEILSPLCDKGDEICDI